MRQRDCPSKQLFVLMYNLASCTLRNPTHFQFGPLCTHPHKLNGTACDDGDNSCVHGSLVVGPSKQRRGLRRAEQTSLGMRKCTTHPLVVLLLLSFWLLPCVICLVIFRTHNDACIEGICRSDPIARFIESPPSVLEETWPVRSFGMGYSPRYREWWFVEYSSSYPNWAYRCGIDLCLSRPCIAWLPFEPDFAGCLVSFCSCHLLLLLVVCRYSHDRSVLIGRFGIPHRYVSVMLLYFACFCVPFACLTSLAVCFTGDGHLARH